MVPSVVHESVNLGVMNSSPTLRGEITVKINE